MDHLMNTEDSYADRRQLFKNIWETAMDIEEKDNDIMNKPKVIKTLRLDEVDRAASKKKKLKLRNLRAVCNKILDFCDRQEADDMFYEQMNAEGQVPTQTVAEIKLKKVKNARIIKKKMKKSKSLYSPARSPARARATTSDRKDNLNSEIVTKASRSLSPIKIRQSNLKGATKTIKKRASVAVSPLEVASTRKVIKTKTKKQSQRQLSQPAGRAMRYYYVVKPTVERVSHAISPPKKLLGVHKININ